MIRHCSGNFDGPFPYSSRGWQERVGEPPESVYVYFMGG